MTKLIVEMEMPSNCSECPLKMDEQTCFNGRGVFGIEVQRMSWCPIVGVLPDEHGDLIDRDEVKKEIMKRMPRGCMSGSSDREGIVCTRRMMLYPISHAKVIVSAERKDDDKTRSNTAS